MLLFVNLQRDPAEVTRFKYTHTHARTAGIAQTQYQPKSSDALGTANQTIKLLYVSEAHSKNPKDTASALYHTRTKQKYRLSRFHCKHKHKHVKWRTSIMAYKRFHFSHVTSMGFVNEKNISFERNLCWIPDSNPESCDWFQVICQLIKHNLSVHKYNSLQAGTARKPYLAPWAAIVGLYLSFTKGGERNSKIMLSARASCSAAVSSAATRLKRNKLHWNALGEDRKAWLPASAAQKAKNNRVP